MLNQDHRHVPLLL